MKNQLIKYFCAVIFCVFIGSCQQEVIPPEPFGATPSARQLDWHKMKYYAFVHFNINTFTDLEWGHGTEEPESFNPTALDCRQWAKVCKEAGMEAIIITAKHHDGFCLWPSKYSEHTVANSPWRDGNGDLLRELSDACKEYGLKMGIYMSPWDRNSSIYGKPEYNDYFVNQLTEVLTNYGEIFEVWFDGAVGEEYKGKQIYDWDRYISTVRELQPNAVIFSDAGPDIRWVGTEKGFANPTNWCTLNKDDYYPGTPDYLDLRSGNKNGTHWLPAEVNTSIRPGWYYHESEDDKVKSIDHLELIYYNSIGRNGNFLLNLPVDRRGLVHENDVVALNGLKERIDNTFKENLALNSTTKSSNNRGNSDEYHSKNVIDENPETFWTTNDDEEEFVIGIDFGEEKTFNIISLSEYLPLGQRVEKVNIEVFKDDSWEIIGTATTIGRTRFIRLPKTTAERIRVNVINAMAPPAISEIEVYFRPHENYLLESKKEFDDRMAWWRNDGFGMFIHWGAYAVPGGIHKGKEIAGIGEWIMNHGQIPIKEYEEYVRQFNPVKFDAEEWVDIAKNAGIKYIVITSKHHDGFCLWDSEITEYDIMDFSPFKRDILGELSEACQKAGIKLCFYHSIMDWHHPDAQGVNYPKYNDDASFNPRFSSYRDNYMLPQLEELITKYDPGVLWFDGEWIKNWTEPQGKDLYNFCRKLKPDLIINNRVGKGRKGRQGMNKAGEFAGDFGTPEQEILEKGSSEIDWESCMTMNRTWGYKKNDNDWKSAKTLIHNLVDIAAKGGNYLLNVGPTGEGEIPEPSVERLKEIGEWMVINSPVIYGSTMWNEYKDGEEIRYTKGQGGECYVTILDWTGNEIQLNHVKPKNGSKIKLLGSNADFEWSWDEKSKLTISIPDSLKNEENLPCKHAWTFKIVGDSPR